MKTLRLFSTVIAGLCALSIVGLAQAQSADGYPNKPIRFVVPFAAGGPTDVIARVIANHLKNSLGQPILIENRTGQERGHSTSRRLHPAVL